MISHDIINLRLGQDGGSDTSVDLELTFSNFSREGALWQFQDLERSTILANLRIYLARRHTDDITQTADVL